MTCKNIESQLERYLDAELTFSDRREIDSHIENCTHCANQLNQLKAIQRNVRNVDFKKCPSSLKNSIRANLRDISNEDIPTNNSFQWLNFSAGLLFFIAAATWVTFQILTPPTKNIDLSLQLVDAHIRSIQVDHLLDIASSNKHTVKPWFTGRLDFSPLVTNSTSHSTKLLGGRMDYVNGRTMAALVYKIRKHLINVFVFNTNGIKSKTKTMTKKGYQLISRTTNGLSYWAVSDLNQKELKAFFDEYLQSLKHFAN